VPEKREPGIGLNDSKTIIAMLILQVKRRTRAVGTTSKRKYINRTAWGLSVVTCLISFED